MCNMRCTVNYCHKFRLLCLKDDKQMAFFSLEVFQIGTVIIWILDHKQVGTELDIANTPAGRKLASLTGLKYSMYSISAMNLASQPSRAICASCIGLSG